MRLLLIFLCFCLIMPNAFGKTKDNSIKTEDIQQTKYTFEENEIGNNNALSGKVVQLKKGTALPITLLTSVNTSTSLKGDEVKAILNEDLEFDGAKIAEKGSLLYGKIVKIKSAAYCMRGGKALINFDKIVTTDNQTYDIVTKNIKFAVVNEDKWITVAQSMLEFIGVAGYIFITGGTGIIVIVAYIAQSERTGFKLFDTKGDDADIPALTPIETSLKTPLRANATY